MSDFFTFRRMITPLIIQVIFVLGSLLSLFAGAALFGRGIANQDARQIWVGLGVFLLGPIVLRLYSEFLIVVFRINETLTDLHQLGTWAADHTEWRDHVEGRADVSGPADEPS